MKINWEGTNKKEPFGEPYLSIIINEDKMQEVKYTNIIRYDNNIIEKQFTGELPKGTILKGRECAGSRVDGEFYYEVGNYEDGLKVISNIEARNKISNLKS